jgi:ribosomal subunit interface protein
MKVQIRARGIALPEPLRAHVTGRLERTLGRFGNEIDRVIVRFSICADERFGERRCELEVRLRPQRLKAEDNASELLAAADHAIDKAARLVARTVQLDAEFNRLAPYPRASRSAKQ